MDKCNALIAFGFVLVSLLVYGFIISEPIEQVRVELKVVDKGVYREFLSTVYYLELEDGSMIDFYVKWKWESYKRGDMYVFYEVAR